MDKKRILIVDDELHIRLALTRLLSKDYVIFEASDGEEAVSITREQKPDLVLMDVMMPKLDGIGACYILKSDLETRRIPIVMLTALAGAPDRQYAEEMGADAYVSKPCNFKELTDTINRFLAGS